MTEVFAFIILALPTIAEVVLDYREWKRGIRDKKALDVVLRGMAFAVAGILVSLFTDHAAWQGALYSLGIFILFFDYTMGFLLKGNPFFLGTTSKTDGWIASHIPVFGVLFGRIVLALSAAITYYRLDLVLYGTN